MSHAFSVSRRPACSHDEAVYAASRKLATLGLQIGVLVVVGALPESFPQVAIVASIALTSGMQIAAFNRVGGLAFTTAVVTTDSMKTIEAILGALAHRTGAFRTTAALIYAPSLLSFVVGAFCGGAASSVIGSRAAWVAAALLAVVALGFIAQPQTNSGVTVAAP